MLKSKLLGIFSSVILNHLGAELMRTIVNAWAHTHKVPTKTSEIKEARLFSESKSHELFTNN